MKIWAFVTEIFAKQYWLSKYFNFQCIFHIFTVSHLKRVPPTIPHPIIPHPILPHPWFYPTLFYPTLILPHPWLYPTLILPHQWLYPTLILPHLMTLPHQWLYPTHDFTPPTKGLGAADKWMMVTILGWGPCSHHPRMITIILLSEAPNPTVGNSHQFHQYYCQPP